MAGGNQAMEVALWRYQVIAPLLNLERGRGILKRELDRLGRIEHEHPVRGVVRIGRGTIEEWLYKYRHEGLDGLLPRPRRDKGISRRIGDEMAEAIVELAESKPELDGPILLQELASQFPENERMPSLSTLYRFLRARGLDQRRAPARRDHRAFAFDLAGDCWQADVMYGPRIPTREGSRRKSYLIAILDDASRLIAHAQFYFEQRLSSLKDCLKQAFLKRGLPRRLYFDNGQIFRSRQVLALAARLGIQILHTRPYQPQGRAKLERWFGTVRRGFLPQVDVDRLEDIDALNRQLFAWIEGHYHQHPHRGIEGETPLDRWLRLSEGIRPLPAEVDLDQLFLEETTRRVAKDGTIRLRGKVFEAGPRWIGQRIRVRFDRFDLRRVTLVDDRDQQRDIFPVDLSANRHVRRETGFEDTPKTPQPLRALKQLADRLESAAAPKEDSHDDN